MIANLFDRLTTNDKRGIWRKSVWLVAGLALLAWLLNTPPGLLGKSDAIGYAICHRIAERSFQIGGRAVSLCARCSGMYLGAVAAIVYQALLGRRRTAWPARWMLAVFGLLLLAFAIDGGNSTFQLFLERGPLYETTNLTRLITGTGMGLALGSLVYPTFNETIWARYSPRPALESGRQFLGLLLVGGVVIALVLTENPLILYPLTLISAFGALALLVMIYTMLVLSILRRENSVADWRGLLLPALGGFLLALAQIAALDLARFVLTGTWAGFDLVF